MAAATNSRPGAPGSADGWSSDGGLSFRHQLIGWRPAERGGRSHQSDSGSRRCGCGRWCAWPKRSCVPSATSPKRVADATLWSPGPGSYWASKSSSACPPPRDQTVATRSDLIATRELMQVGLDERRDETKATRSDLNTIHTLLTTDIVGLAADARFSGTTPRRPGTRWSAPRSCCRPASRWSTVATGSRHCVRWWSRSPNGSAMSTSANPC